MSVVILMYAVRKLPTAVRNWSGKDQPHRYIQPSEKDTSTDLRRSE